MSPPRKGNLRAGRNILAIQGLNDSSRQRDMIIVPELYGGKSRPPDDATSRSINFGAIEVSPSSGDQDAGIHSAAQSQRDCRGYL